MTMRIPTTIHIYLISHIHYWLNLENIGIINQTTFRVQENLRKVILFIV